MLLDWVEVYLKQIHLGGVRNGFYILLVLIQILNTILNLVVIELVFLYLIYSLQMVFKDELLELLKLANQKFAVVVVLDNSVDKLLVLVLEVYVEVVKNTYVLVALDLFGHFSLIFFYYQMVEVEHLRVNLLNVNLAGIHRLPLGFHFRTPRLPQEIALGVYKALNVVVHLPVELLKTLDNIVLILAELYNPVFNFKAKLNEVRNVVVQLYY